MGNELSLSKSQTHRSNEDIAKKKNSKSLLEEKNLRQESIERLENLKSFMSA